MRWIKRIIGFIKLYNDYEYEPEDWRHIVDTYEQVLCNRTKTMSKPTYYLSDILNEMDKWYEYYKNEAVLDALNDAFNKLEKYEDGDGWLKLKLSSIFYILGLDK